MSEPLVEARRFEPINPFDTGRSLRAIRDDINDMVGDHYPLFGLLAEEEAAIRREERSIADDRHPKLVIRVHDGMTVFTTVQIDGHNYPVTRVMFDTGDSQNNPSGLVLVHLTMLADIDIEMTGERPGVEIV